MCTAQHFGGYVMEVWDGIIHCIPLFLYLVELHTLMFPTSAALLLESIRENGSLLRYLYHCGKYSPVFHSCDVTRLNAYGERNKFLPKLLGTHVRTSSEDDVRLSLFPSLFSIAKQASRMGTNFLFLGLLMCTCSNGLNERVRGEKRSSLGS
jgi:hypothetical protein